MNPWVKKLLGLLTSIPAEERDAVWDELNSLLGQARSGAPSEPLLTYEEACNLLRCHRSTVHRALPIQGKLWSRKALLKQGRDSRKKISA